jgi:D-alanyl-D-alanine carboxypeptidase/D-alanyl-D-alanine-endopeptidase (penicillin-binding protein 4)
VKRAVALLTALVALATCLPSSAAALAPDRPTRTPVARSAAATATTSISRSALCARLRTKLRSAGGANGLFVIDAGTGQRVCGSRGKVKRIPASNMKLFTTATALARFGPEQRLQTALYRTGSINAAGVLQGDLYLVGGGDPALSSPDFARRFLGGLGTDLSDLSKEIEAAGITRVTGRLFADDTIFDRLRGVADSGFETSPYIGPLSGLSFNSGYADSGARRFASDPALVAADSLADSLKADGVQISSNVSLRTMPAQGATKIAEVGSPKMAVLSNETNVYSNNFYAEMLLKSVGAHFGDGGSTRSGSVVVQRYVRGLGSAVRMIDGSGLSRGNRATAAQVARLLAAMQGTDVAEEFANSLPVAGREGTVASRMRGTAAAGRCRTKTGTLTGVSALSGYCFNRSGKVMAFAILNNQVSSLYSAHLQQDRMAALIARY